ncbi:MAG: ribosome biogenesis GTPase YlqF [Dialister sp.]|jgi:ribosome biogenesis GTPase A|uniref:ribosome biogenesis GTPase YlqF n=1 Tax=Dialister sp. TaxID=1955814 RepID=UPI00257BC131|nr:ribosome biogenesis GTPase YlqF [Dialister sp.]MBS6294839.1 ribosome biogenesis GTPase YlqF [Dialister sp.]
MLIQWFPGHMAKTKRLIIEHLKAVDVAAELLDARIPLSSANPMVEELLSGKPRIVILNKADLADPGMTKAWESYYKRKGVAAVSMSCGNGKDKKKFLRLIKEAVGPMLEKWKRRGLKTRSARIMILGIPNVGKSTLINFISGTAAARTANTPGHTRGKQWVRLSQGLDLLDTPGVLWPKFEDQVAALRLAATGAIAGDVFDADTVVPELMRVLARTAPDALREKYGIEDAAADPQILLAQAGKRRGCILPGGAIDYARAQTMILNDFRSGKLGRITLDAVPAEEV